MSDDPCSAGLFAQRLERRRGAADLERPGLLEAFRLQEDAAARRLIQQP
jgi:hypothetical protein